MRRTILAVTAAALLLFGCTSGDSSSSDPPAGATAPPPPPPRPSPTGPAPGVTDTSVKVGVTYMSTWPAWPASSTSTTATTRRPTRAVRLDQRRGQHQQPHHRAGLRPPSPRPGTAADARLHEAHRGRRRLPHHGLLPRRQRAVPGRGPLDRRSSAACSPPKRLAQADAPGTPTRAVRDLPGRGRALDGRGGRPRRHRRRLPEA